MLAVLGCGAIVVAMKGMFWDGTGMVFEIERYKKGKMGKEGRPDVHLCVMDLRKND